MWSRQAMDRGVDGSGFRPLRAGLGPAFALSCGLPEVIPARRTSQPERSSTGAEPGIPVTPYSRHSLRRRGSATKVSLP